MAVQKDQQKKSPYLINDHTFNRIIQGLDDKTEDQDMACVSDGIWIFRQGNKMHRIALHRFSDGRAQIAYKGGFFEGKKLSHKDQLKQKLQAASEENATSKDVKSPMPGTVLRLLKKPGDSVEKGETVLIIEAMKMENEIKSPMTGKVSNLKVEAQQPVTNRQFLFTVQVD